MHFATVALLNKILSRLKLTQVLSSSYALYFPSIGCTGGRWGWGSRFEQWINRCEEREAWTTSARPGVVAARETQPSACLTGLRETCKWGTAGGKTAPSHPVQITVG